MYRMTDPYALIDAMAFNIIDEHRKKRPKEYAGYSGEGNEHCINDTKYHLSFLFDAASIESPQLFINYVAWAKVLMEHLGISDIIFREVLEHMWGECRKRLDGPFAMTVDGIMETTLDQYSDMPLSIPGFLDENERTGSLAKRYLELILSGKRREAQDLIRKVGGALSRRNDVNLKEPDTVVRMHMSDRVHLFLEERAVDRDLMETRKVGERPFFSPISLHPKYARALINLTGVKRGGTVLDPFCGTGGILIEAAEMGMKAVASDFDEEMIIGCQENMEFYNLELSDMEVIDIGDIPGRFSDIDAVATDPPYGRSTRTGGEDIGRIYRRAMDAIPAVLKDGARAGIVLPDEISCNGMDLESVYVQRVHGSLSRHYHVFRKRNGQVF